MQERQFTTSLLDKTKQQLLKTQKMKSKILVFLNTIFLFFAKMSFSHSNYSALDAMLEQMQKDNSFETMNFESMNLSSSEMATARKIAPVMMKKMIASNGSVRTYGQQASPEIVGQLEMNSKGDVNITITRNSENILDDNGNPVVLPVVLFGANDFSAKYVGTLTGLVPAGITYSIANSSTGDVVFTYVRTSDNATDTITVTNLGNISMVNFLASMNNNYFATNYMKLTIPNDSNIATQFAQPILYGLLSALGAKNFNQLIPRSRVHSWDYNTYILEVLMPSQKIVPDFQFVFYMTGGEGSYIGLDTFMSERGNLNNLMGRNTSNVG